MYQTSGSVNGDVAVVAVVVPEVALALTVKEVALAHKSFAGAGAGILKVAEVTDVKPVLVKIIVALLTAAALVAVKLVKVAKPEEAVFGVVPPKVHVPAPTVATTEAVLDVTVFPY